MKGTHMARRFLYVSGCDDSTTVEITDLPDDQIAVIQMVAKRVSDASTYQCHPEAEVIDENHYGARDYIESENNR